MKNGNLGRLTSLALTSLFVLASAAPIHFAYADTNSGNDTMNQGQSNAGQPGVSGSTTSDQNPSSTTSTEESTTTKKTQKSNQQPGAAASGSPGTSGSSTSGSDSSSGNSMNQ